MMLLFIFRRSWHFLIVFFLDMLEAQWTLSHFVSSHYFKVCLDNFQDFWCYWKAPQSTCMIYGRGTQL